MKQIRYSIAPIHPVLGVYALLCSGYIQVSGYFMTTQKHIEEFSEALKIILNAEIKRGNEIVETSKGWPNDETIIIFLKKPFMGIYQAENIDYRNIDDIHYWKAEYSDKLTNHILACKF
ncbi:hypothetical protein WFZ85_14980 [Flavobacterium sp. j3]|uniref:DUF1330 domain-containing protein n=1 Tax=Flavobacterium aureirubrum TaxID=3133147 RepID=A0ABU9N8S7_9FLAO